MDQFKAFLTKRNIATFLIVGIMILAIPFGLKLSQSQNQVNSQAAEGICLDQTHMDHAPLYPINFYKAIEDSDDGACISKTHYTGEQPCGFIWKPDHGKLHLQMYDASKIGGCQQEDKSFCSDAYYSVINDPLFSIAVALIDNLFKLDKTNYILAVSNPALGGRGDDRNFDPAFNVAGILGATSGNYFHQLNPNNIHDPVEWLYDRGFWARPANGPGSTPRPGVSNPAPTGKGFAEEYYRHYINSFTVDPRGHTGMTADQKSLIDYVKSHNLRQKNWTELSCVSNPATSNNAICAGAINAPDNVSPGQTFNASVTITNSGSKVWDTDMSYRLGRWDNTTNQGWRLPDVNSDRVALPQSPVNSGSNITFNFPVIAPSTIGSKTLDLRMVQDGVEWFGQTCSKSIIITRPVCAAGDTTSAGCIPSSPPSTPPSAPPSGSALVCDFNKDGVYDDKDFNLWKDEFTGNRTTKKSDCTGVNGTADGIVDLLDFNKWRDEKIAKE